VLPNLWHSYLMHRIRIVLRIVLMFLILIRPVLSVTSRSPRDAIKCREKIYFLKAIPKTSRGGPYVSETSRLQYFLDGRLTDSGEVASFTRRPHFTPMKIPCFYFCYRLSRPESHSTAGGIRTVEKSIFLIKNRTRSLLACKILS
jgi:hypothetical protein